MRAVIAATLVVLFTTAAPSAQTTADADTAAQLHKGQIKVWLGSVLIGAGALIVPVTTTHSSPKMPSEGSVVGGVGLAACGSYLVWLGINEQRQAVRPQTTFGVVVGRKSGVQVRRTW